jgi:predicted nicotinamide N-methyase
MPYPNTLTAVDEGLTLYVPEPESVKTIYERLLTEDNSTRFPFWARIWPSSKAMTAFLRKERFWVEGKRVLEIGAGIGLPSFDSAGHAREMIISDHSIEAVELAEKNIRHLGLKNVKAMYLDWNHFPEGVVGETVLLSDVNYSPDEFGNLLDLIQRFLERGATVIISTPQRLAATKFVDAVQPYIQESMQMTIDGQGQTSDICILVLSL